MSTLEDDWRADLDAVDVALIDDYQSGFPVEARPFRRVGAALDIGEDEALERVRALRERGIVRRFGAVLNPPVIGSSTLAAVRAPEERFEEVAAVINSYRQVNHNYRRDHEWNTWFVVTAGSRETRDRILAEIEERTGCSVLCLPMLTDFYIDLEFPVVNADRFARESSSESERVEATAISEEATGDLSALDVAVLLEIQEGLPLSRTPYADVARAVGYGTDAVIDSISRLLENGCIKRIGCVINHVATGFDANCMVVWDVPDGELAERGRTVGALPAVTLCYHRPRRSELGWEYNLFTMIHGRDPEAVDARIDELYGEHLPYEHERLYSTETLKQTGARYDELLSG
ncbi:Lrp/AsnC family transcriptional regulator [Halalkalicoccus sp. NIPERK01]|uniref:siroheme decarboxylase subunit beta n=1 Tax=Halalkalicoccus sp. NIPERK01 TaxID=3053469 RepID=UPI00256F0F10|nr:Lrp/AsnC family transcriptional regulator [Halalkalicoccus sp. NIPERK01]MDL5362189.1 Lrp/AsnC family transcriptional regulator [Halalkalicoccus sp. NIPERK01]